MLKLKLESLKVDSFEVTGAVPQGRGTVRGNAAIDTGGQVQPYTTGPVSIDTYDVRRCGETQYFDCTFGCSINTLCATGCTIQPVYNSADCAVEIG